MVHSHQTAQVQKLEVKHAKSVTASDSACAPAL